MFLTVHQSVKLSVEVTRFSLLFILKHCQLSQALVPLDETKALNLNEHVSMADTIKQIETYETLFFQELSHVTSLSELELFRVKHLSRHGALSTLMQGLKELPLEAKKLYGPLYNSLKERTLAAFNEVEAKFQQELIAAQEHRTAHFDVTAYKPLPFKGSLHPYTHVIEQVESIFMSMGFQTVDGPEIETDFYNFEALNIPKDHPARDMQDTFWLTLPDFLMRTHTSSVAIHTMLKQKPPIAIIVPGRAYRNEATDASHEFMFMQLEGLFIDKNVSLANLIATMKSFLQALFEKTDIEVEFKPSYYPFVEPGIDIIMTCPFCTNGCSVCKRTTQIEMGGAGLTHPQVLKACNLDPNEYSGFAFGLGLTRLVMLKYGIPDIRLLHSNKLEFIEQF